MKPVTGDSESTPEEEEEEVEHKIRSTKTRVVPYILEAKGWAPFIRTFSEDSCAAAFNINSYHHN